MLHPRPSVTVPREICVVQVPDDASAGESSQRLFLRLQKTGEARRLADPAECVWIAASAKWVQRSVEREQEDGAEMGDHYRRVRAGVVDWAP